MCVIITTPNQKNRPCLATLRACEKANPHGSGIAWVQKKKVQFIKGLSADAISELLDVIEGPAVIHFRIATVGGKRAELCHPFPISPDAPLKPYGQASAVLFHNGHWNGWEEFAKEHEITLDGPVSDSRIAAVGTFHLGRAFLRGMETGRFVIFSKKGTEHFGEWHEAEGCHFSNLISITPLPKKLKVETPKPYKKIPGAEDWGASAQPQLPPAPAKKEQTEFKLSPRTPRGRSLVEEAMACYGD